MISDVRSASRQAKFYCLFSFINRVFPQYRKLAMLTFLYCLNLKNMAARKIHHINKNSQHHGKCKFAFKLIRFLTVSNLFTLEIVQKCQHCQLCVLWENSKVYFYIEEHKEGISNLTGTPLPGRDRVGTFLVVTLRNCEEAVHFSFPLLDD